MQHYPDVLWTHVANERKTDVKTNKKGVAYSPAGAKLKAKGVKRGVPDILIFTRRGQYNGLAIELKVGKGKATPEQLEWLSRLQKEGWLTMLTNDIDDLQNAVEKYLKL
jgi:hypothetical protein